MAASTENPSVSQDSEASQAHEHARACRELLHEVFGYWDEQIRALERALGTELASLQKDSPISLPVLLRYRWMQQIALSSSIAEMQRETTSFEHQMPNLSDAHELLEYIRTGSSKQFELWVSAICNPYSSDVISQVCVFLLKKRYFTQLLKKINHGAEPEDRVVVNSATMV